MKRSMSKLVNQQIKDGRAMFSERNISNDLFICVVKYFEIAIVTRLSRIRLISIIEFISIKFGTNPKMCIETTEYLVRVYPYFTEITNVMFLTYLHQTM